MVRDVPEVLDVISQSKSLNAAIARELRDALNLLNSIADDCELLNEALATGECATLAEARVRVQNIHALAVTFQVRDDG